MKTTILSAVFAIATAAAFAGGNTPAAPMISGDYLEVRSCDVYTGSCFANAEMNLAGKEGMMFWSVREGSWNGARLDGLSVMAIVKTEATLGDVTFQPQNGEAVLIIDARANGKQREALADFARAMAGKLTTKIADVQTASITAKLGTCTQSGCASVKAGDLVEISTSCLGGKHDVCGNEETFYPPLSKVEGAYPVFTDVASFNGSGLDVTWQIAGKRSAFLATFAVPERKSADLALTVR